MNGTHFLIYTTEVGGDFYVVKGTREQYDKAVKTGRLAIPSWDGSTDCPKVVLVALATVEDNYDTFNGASRG